MHVIRSTERSGWRQDVSWSGTEVQIFPQLVQQVMTLTVSTAAVHQNAAVLTPYWRFCKHQTYASLGGRSIPDFSKSFQRITFWGTNKSSFIPRATQTDDWHDKQMELCCSCCRAFWSCSQPSVQPLPGFSLLNALFCLFVCFQQYWYMHFCSLC